MRYRLMRVFAALAATAVAVLGAAGPASAANGPPTVGCTTGSSCSVELHYWWPVTGSTGGSNPVSYQPPPCIGVPVGDAYAGSQVIISIYAPTAPVPSPSTASPSAGPRGTSSPSPSATSPSPSASASTSPSPQSNLPPQEQAIYDQAQQLVSTHPEPAGEWYQIAGNPAASTGDQQACSSLPPYVFVKGGGKLPVVGGVNVPPETLAAYAYSQLQTARLAAVTANPRAMSDTNLPTFVNTWISLPRRAPGLLQVTGPGTVPGTGWPFVWATAMTPNGTAATVWAWVTGFSVKVDPPGSATIFPDPSNAFDQQRCATVSGAKRMPWGATGYKIGSRYTKAQMALVGAGQPIDCGVTFTAPGPYNLTVSVSWNACWSEGEATTPGPPAGNVQGTNTPLCQPVPGAGGLQDSQSPSLPVNVREIQSVNG